MCIGHPRTLCGSTVFTCNRDIDGPLGTGKVFALSSSKQIPLATLKSFLRPIHFQQVSVGPLLRGVLICCSTIGTLEEELMTSQTTN